MKIFFTGIFLFLLYVAIATTTTLANSGSAYESEIDGQLIKIFSQADQCKILQESLTFLAEEIKKNPDAVFLRKTHSALSFGYSDFPGAIDDLEVIIRIIPDDVESMMNLCVVREAQSNDYRSLLPCYANVVAVYREQIKNGTRQKDRDYIHTLLMADMPEAQAEKERYLKGLGNSLFDEAERKSLNSFDRAKAIPQYPLCPGSPQRADVPPTATP
ncbi:MAG: hypothetical protein LBU06_08335 [Desulfovibrio sp.]|nr:hypothetical protein [Desulfovibrio sp.]